MNDSEELTPKWLGENMKLIHYLLKKRNICESWYPNYEDRVQDIFECILRNIPKYKPEVASKSTYIELLVRQELFRHVSANERLAASAEQIEEWHEPAFECSIDTQIYAEQEYDKLTEIQKMEAEGYTFKEIGKEVGLSPDYIRNKKGLATRGKR